MGQTFRIPIADEHYRCSKNVTRSCGSQTYRTRSGNVDDRADFDTCGLCAVIPGRQNVGEHGEIFDLRHCLIFVGKFKQVEIGVWHKNILCLSANPSAHVNVAIGSARLLRVHIETDAGVPLTAGTTASAGNIKGHRNEIAEIDKLNVFALFNDFAGDFVAQNKAFGCSSAAPHHVLVGAADIG